METGTAIIVTGAARGGTSAVAAALDALGIFLGDGAARPNFEDPHLARAFHDRDWRRFAARAAAYESRHPLFAWKLPNVAAQLPRIHQLFARPRYVFVFRDLPAVGSRVAALADRPTLAAMRQTLRQYDRILTFIARRSPVHLVLSYEKMLTEPEGFARALLAFLGLEERCELIEAVGAAIAPSPAEYAAWTEAVRLGEALGAVGFAGFLEDVTRSGVRGWAKATRDGSPVVVDVFVNGRKVAAVAADAFRQDLVDGGVSDHGRHGFALTLPVALAPGDWVAVRLKDSPQDLVGSPRQVDRRPHLWRSRRGRPFHGTVGGCLGRRRHGLRLGARGQGARREARVPPVYGCVGQAIG